MHQSAHDWVAQHATGDRVLDIGGRDINGTVRDLFRKTDYTTIDLREGRGVDVVGDVCVYKPRAKFDTIVCCEVLEHVKDWQAIIDAAHRLCRIGGRFIVTCAAPGRPAHSAEDGGELREGEHYASISADALRVALKAWRDVVIEFDILDIRAVATR